MIEPVERLDDGRVAAYAHVGDAPWLRAQGLFVAEGRLVVRRLVEDGRFEVVSALVTPAALEAMAGVLGSGSPFPVYLCPQETLNAIAGFNFHRGCLALARRPAAMSAAVSPAARVVVALEGVGNPDNVGGIFRSAHAFGASFVLLDSACADPLYRKSIRTSMGAALRVPFEQSSSSLERLNRLKALGFRVLAFTPAGDAVDLGAVARGRDDRVVLLFGSEGEGLSPGALAASDLRVRIRIDPASDSLNVAVAAGIALHWFGGVGR